jgi:hypothetical protein
MDFKKRSVSLLAAGAALSLLTPAAGWACACGCGVFDVGTSALFPKKEGGLAFLEYDFMDQGTNWHGHSRSGAANNEDKDIRTHFVTVGAEYMFSRAWGVEAQVPYWKRHFLTTDDATGSEVAFGHGSLGDVRIKGIYTGFSEDMASGMTFGAKLSTGRTAQEGLDRDTAIGSGSTDVLLGGYHQAHFAGAFNWFTSGELDLPVLTKGDYHPGAELNATWGVYHTGWRVGAVQVAPLAQLAATYRHPDRGMDAEPGNTGYTRALFAPGLEVHAGEYRLYADIGLPFYQEVRGEQLVAREMFKFNISRSF